MELHIDRDNGASRAVAQRTGFTRVDEPLVQREETAHFVNDIFFRARRHESAAGETVAPWTTQI